MARQRRLAPVVVQNETSGRDAVMARLFAARASMQAAIEAVDDAGGAFVNPESDAKGKERKQLVAEALECVGTASRALEDAEREMATFDKDDWAEREPWEEEDGDEDEDEDDEEDEDDDD